jgi:hypothetical protein
MLEINYGQSDQRMKNQHSGFVVKDRKTIYQEGA